MAYNATQVTTKAFAITPNDSTVISVFGLYVGSTGDVTVLPFESASPVTFVAVPAGQIIPLCVAKVMLTGTTADNIVGFGPN